MSGKHIRETTVTPIRLHKDGIKCAKMQRKNMQNEFQEELFVVRYGSNMVKISPFIASQIASCGRYAK